MTAYGGGIVHGDVFLVTGSVLVALAVLGTVVWGDRRAASLGLLIWLLPLALVVSLGLRSGLFEVRYLVLSLPGLALLAAAGIVRLARHPFAALAVGLVALVPFGLGLSAQYFDPTLARDDYRGLVASIEAEASTTKTMRLPVFRSRTFCLRSWVSSCNWLGAFGVAWRRVI